MRIFQLDTEFLLSQQINRLLFLVTSLHHQHLIDHHTAVIIAFDYKLVIATTRSFNKPFHFDTEIVRINDRSVIFIKLDVIFINLLCFFIAFPIFIAINIDLQSITIRFIFIAHNTITTVFFNRLSNISFLVFDLYFDLFLLFNLFFQIIYFFMIKFQIINHILHLVGKLGHKLVVDFVLFLLLSKKQITFYTLFNYPINLFR